MSGACAAFEVSLNTLYGMKEPLREEPADVIENHGPFS
jgi:hypothetical protein